MTPADRTAAIREPAAGGRRRPPALPRPLGSLAPLRARIKVPILENLTLDGRKALEKLLAANKRLNKAYLLKESFGQLWDYEIEGWARRFFDNWRASLKWQRLTPVSYTHLRAHETRHD